ncbi:hypothetical protein ACFLWS_06505 [Chloroflexota bacterium]
MVINSLSETRQVPRCQRFGGQVLHNYDDSSCLQCGAPYSKEDKLVNPLYLAIESLLAQREMAHTN